MIYLDTRPFQSFSQSQFIINHILTCNVLISFVIVYKQLNSEVLNVLIALHLIFSSEQ